MISWPVEPARLPARNLELFNSKLLTRSHSPPVVSGSAWILHSQHLLVLLEGHEVDGGVWDDPGEGGGVTSPEREEALCLVAVSRPSYGVPEPVVPRLVGLEEYLGSEIFSITTSLSLEAVDQPVERSYHSLGHTSSYSPRGQAGQDLATVGEVGLLSGGSAGWFCLMTLSGHSLWQVLFTTLLSRNIHFVRLVSYILNSQVWRENIWNKRLGQS